VFNEPAADLALVACPHCDLLQRLPSPESHPKLAPGASARCPRCDAELWRPRVDSLNRTLALTVAALILYAIANTFPMPGSPRSVIRRRRPLGGAHQLWVDGRVIVAGLVLFTAVIAPGLQIGLVLAIVVGARRERVPQWVGRLLRYHPTARTWSMIEVMLLGVLVALIKIAELATVVPGTALFALGALVFVFAGIQSSFDPREVWERIEWSEPASP
jgi:paraquat-inducible protein A